VSDDLKLYPCWETPEELQRSIDAGTFPVDGLIDVVLIDNGMKQNPCMKRPRLVAQTIGQAMLGYRLLRSEFRAWLDSGLYDLRLYEHGFWKDIC
jgi:hypothetical protein